MLNLKSTFYEDKETQDIMKKFYQIQRNLISSQLSKVQEKLPSVANDHISHPTPVSPQKHKNTNHRV